VSSRRSAARTINSDILTHTSLRMSPGKTTGTLIREDGTTIRYVDIDFTHGNYGSFVDDGRVQTCMARMYEGQWGWSGGIGKFFQGDGSGYVEVFFGGREVGYGHSKNLPQIKPPMDEGHSTDESADRDGWHLLNIDGNTGLAREFECPADPVISGDVFKSEDTSDFECICWDNGAGFRAWLWESLRLPLTAVPPVASDTHRVLLDDLFGSEQIF